MLVTLHPTVLHSQTLEDAKVTSNQLVSLKEKADDVSQLLKSLKTPTIEDKIRLSAIKYGVSKSVALNVACAESLFDAHAKNPNSTAEGVYQWLDGSWKSYGQKYWGSLEGRSKLDADDNIELSMLVLKDVGTKDWEASRKDGYGGGWSNTPYEKGVCIIK